MCVSVCVCVCVRVCVCVCACVYARAHAPLTLAQLHDDPQLRVVKVRTVKTNDGRMSHLSQNVNLRMNEQVVKTSSSNAC
jgi:hypothetical protein